MTARALANLPIDWQILLNSGADEQAIRDEIERVARPTALETVTYADVPGLSAESEGTVQTTGAAKVLGFGPRYRSAFPAEISMSLGGPNGVLVAQQTAANLHVTVGNVITVQRIGLPPVQVKVEGVVNLPDADALFQAVGLPAGAAPQAPPDNVLLLPVELWHRLFDEQAAGRPDSARVQLHVRVARDLPAIRTPPTRGRSVLPTAWKRASPGAAWSATTSPPASIMCGRMPFTRVFCSCFSACPASSWLAC